MSAVTVSHGQSFGRRVSSCFSFFLRCPFMAGSQLIQRSDHQSCSNDVDDRDSVLISVTTTKTKMADSSEEADQGGRTRTVAAIPGPSHVDSSPLDQPAVRRKRFHAFRIVHKIFRRKSKRKYDTDERNVTIGGNSSADVDSGGCRSRGKSRSTSELAVVECRRPSVHPPGRSTTHSASATSNLLSLSHDSVFAPDDDDDDDAQEADASSSSSPPDRYNPRKLLHFTRRRFSVKGMKEELMNKLRARRDQSAGGRRGEDDDDDDDGDDDEEDDDPGLPHSPCSVNTSPTTAEVLGQGLLDERARAKKGSKLRSSDNSLLSMGSSETDNEIESGGGGIGLKLMIFDRRQNADPDLDLGPTVLLNHRAAHHRIAIKPRRTRAVPCKHRTLHQVTGGSLPMTPEDAEETTGIVAAASGELRTKSESLSKPLPPNNSTNNDKLHYSQSTIQTSESSRVTNNKSHAAECKLKHEIARYEQRMSQLSTTASSEMDVEVGPRSMNKTTTTTDFSSIQSEEVEVVTTSCFGFGIGRTRKTRVESPASVTEDAKKQPQQQQQTVTIAATKKSSSVAVGVGDDTKVNLSKVFGGSRLSGRKKKADDAQKQVDWNVSKVQQQQQQGSSSSCSSGEARMSKLSTDLMTADDSGHNRSSETITSKSRPLDVDVNLSPRRHSCHNVDDNVVIHKHTSDRLSSEGDGGCSTTSSGLASLIGETAKRKSVQHQLTKEDIDELESFLPCSRRSLPESSTTTTTTIDPSARPTRRPLRFSFGSAKDVEGSCPSVELASVSSNVGDHASKLAIASSNCSRLIDEKTRSSVVRLDVAWIETSPHPTKVDNASSSCITNKDSSSVAAVEQESPSSLTFDDTSAMAAVPPPPLPLRRQKQCNSGKADEPELFKVFHRRSLKLKDTDIPVVYQSVGGVRRDSSPPPSPHSVEQTPSAVTVPATDLGLNTDQQQQQQPTKSAFVGEIGSRRRSSIGCNVVDQNDNNNLESTSSTKATWVECDAVAPNTQVVSSSSSDVEPVKELSNDEDSSPIIQQTNSKSTRSSKVLDLVRNFQKLQAT